VTSPAARPLLEIRDLRVSFPVEGGAARAVDGLDLTVMPGEMVGLVGESGCGKSVTALAILRLVEPEGHIAHGSVIRLEGRDLLALPEKEMRNVRGNHVGLVFQEPLSALNPVLTVGSQIAEVVRTHEKVSRTEARWRAVEMLKLVGVPEPEKRARHYPHQLSGGMRQRVMIGIALACRPKLLMADEPTTALDVTIQAEILELLDNLQRTLGMAALLITHNFGIVAERTARVSVMYAGHVVEEAPTGRLFASPSHPYTQGLLAAVPGLTEPRSRLAAIPGQVPPATSWPGGCRFHPRCPFAWEKCRSEPPPTLEVAPGHRARCWLVAEPQRRTHARAAAPTHGAPPASSSGVSEPPT
jgi:oligopeptide/dipeptide ABC transporter ATP-binding protein